MNALVYTKSSLYPGGSKIKHMAWVNVFGTCPTTWCGKKSAHILKRDAGSIEATCKKCNRAALRTTKEGVE